MNKLIEYFQSEPKIFWLGIGTVIAIILFSVIIILWRKRMHRIESQPLFPETEDKKQSTTEENKSTTEDDKPKTTTENKPTLTQTDNANKTSKEVSPKQTEENKQSVTTASSQQKTTSVETETNNKQEEAKTTNKPTTAPTASVNPPKKETATTPTTKEPTSQPPANTEKKTKQKATTKNSGKWIIYSYLDEKQTRYYTARLKANNGETLLDLESYTTLSGVKSGLDNVKKNIAEDNFSFKGDKNGNWNFKLYSSNKMLLCLGEGYTSKVNCESAIASVKKFSETATVSDLTTKETLDTLETRMSTAPVNISVKTDKVAGKWVISALTEGEKTWYTAQLKANNGVVILNTEYYASLNGIRSGIDTIKKNVESNNFDIKQDKNGNWNFKLYNARKMLLCIGEGYTSKTNCESAIASVVRFATNSTIVENKQ